MNNPDSHIRSALEISALKWGDDYFWDFQEDELPLFDFSGATEEDANPEPDYDDDPDLWMEWNLETSRTLFPERDVVAVVNRDTEFYHF